MQTPIQPVVLCVALSLLAVESNSLRAEENSPAASRRFVLWANVSSGSAKVTAGITVGPPDMPRIPTRFLGAKEDLGTVWGRQAGEAFTCQFSLPETARVAGFRLSYFVPEDNGSSSMKVTVNDQEIGNKGPVGTGKVVPHVFAEASSAGKWKTGQNEIRIVSPRGEFGIQSLRVEYDLPLPTWSFGNEDAPIKLTLLTPVLGEVIDRERGVLITWEAENFPENGVVMIRYQGTNGQLRDIPGAQFSPSSPVQHKYCGSFLWQPQQELDNVKIILHFAQGASWVFEKETPKPIKLRLFSPSRWELVPEGEGVHIRWEAESFPNDGVVTIHYRQGGGERRTIPGAHFTPTSTVWQGNRGSFLWQPWMYWQKEELKDVSVDLGFHRATAWEHGDKAKPIVLKLLWPPPKASIPQGKQLCVTWEAENFPKDGVVMIRYREGEGPLETMPGAGYLLRNSPEWEGEGNCGHRVWTPNKDLKNVSIALDYYPRTITNSIGMRLALIPAGEFMMGDPTPITNKLFRHPMHPIHRVRITRPFYLGACEVTQNQYEQIMGRIPSLFKGGTRPVEMVTWNDAVEFCRRLSEKESQTYRLPTEAEWEYACRAGTTTYFYWGDRRDHETMKAHGWYAENAYHSEKGPRQRKWLGPYQADEGTQPVGRKRPNAWGLHDMHGNVKEWCQDRYDEHYYSYSPTDDPTGPPSGSLRVVRGEAWVAAKLFEPEFRSYRNLNGSQSGPGGMSKLFPMRAGELGFRVVLVPAFPSGG